MTVIHMASRHRAASDPAGREGVPWWERASCRETDPDIFHPTGRDVRMLAEAKAVCAGCLVREECLQEALDTSQDLGVRGGLSEQERRAIHRRPSAAPHQAGMPGKAQALAEAPEMYCQVVGQGLTPYAIAQALKTNVQTVNAVARLLADRAADGGTDSGESAAAGREEDAT